MRVVVYGSRPDGHARVVVELVRAVGSLEIVGLIDDVPGNSARRVGDLSVIGSRPDLPRLRDDGVEGVLLGFGGARGRAEVVAAVTAVGLALPTVVHPFSEIALSAVIRDGAQILPGVCVGPGAAVGVGVLLNTGVVVEHDVAVGSCAVLDPGAVVTGRARVGEGAEIGSRAVVLPDVLVGDFAVVGAGAVVVREVAPRETVVGVPARPVAR